MKTKMIVTALLVLVLSVSLSNQAKADPWRGCHHGWCGPRPVVRVFAPVPPVIFPAPVVVGGYYGYHRPHYYGYHGYRHEYYGHHRYYR